MERGWRRGLASSGRGGTRPHPRRGQPLCARLGHLLELRGKRRGSVRRRQGEGTSVTLGSYPLDRAYALPSPSVLVFRAYLERNLDRMIALAGGPERLRPHCKTHKTREIV